MLEFKIVEDKSEDKYHDYIDLYREGMTIRKIAEKLQISLNKCSTFYKHAVDDGLITPRKPEKQTKKQETDNAPKYYHFNKKGGYWVVYSPLTKSRKQKHFGTYNSEEEAQYVVYELKKVNWNRKCLKNIQLKAMELFP